MSIDKRIKLVTQANNMSGGRRVGDQRAHDMAIRYSAGESLQSIALGYNISRERVRQIIKRLGLNGSNSGRRPNIHAEAVRKQVKREEQRRMIKKERLESRYHCECELVEKLRNVYPSGNKNPIDRFLMLGANCKRRNIYFDLTLAQWWSVWDQSGKWPECGVGKGKYAMVPIDRGLGYTEGNIEIVKFEHVTALGRERRK